MILPVPAVMFKVCVPFKVPPKVTSAPGLEVAVLTVVAAFKVAPPVPKLMAWDGVKIEPPRLLGALPVKFKPPWKTLLSALELPKVTKPLFKKSTLVVKLLLEPVRLTLYALFVVIRSVAVTLPSKAIVLAAVVLVMVILPALTAPVKVVPLLLVIVNSPTVALVALIAPAVPALRLKF